MFALVMIGEYDTKIEVWRLMYLIEVRNFSFFFLSLYVRTNLRVTRGIGIFGWKAETCRPTHTHTHTHTRK
jgi:hypothetical protein